MKLLETNNCLELSLRNSIPNTINLFTLANKIRNKMLILMKIVKLLDFQVL